MHIHANVIRRAQIASARNAWKVGQRRSPRRREEAGRFDSCVFSSSMENCGRPEWNSSPQSRAASPCNRAGSMAGLTSSASSASRPRIARLIACPQVPIVHVSLLQSAPMVPIPDLYAQRARLPMHLKRLGPPRGLRPPGLAACGAVTFGQARLSRFSQLHSASRALLLSQGGDAALCALVAPAQTQVLRSLMPGTISTSSAKLRLPLPYPCRGLFDACNDHRSACARVGAGSPRRALAGVLRP